MKRFGLRPYLEQQENADCYSGQPLIEVIGSRRVLIENHRGVILYEPEQIGVKVKNGIIYIWGSSLSLMKMSKSQIVITGSVQKICIEEGL